jgi:putative SOS response-associated peptidase YedK
LRVCGRATLSSPAEDVAALFEAPSIDIGPARFNIAPTQPVLTVRSAPPLNEEESASGRGRQLTMVRWGLIPWWAKPDEAKKIASRCIQARAETAQRAPAFRDAFKRHRCLVVVDGFFEWKTLPDGRRVPHLARRRGGGPFAIAALWDAWRPPDEDEKVESCAVLTTRSAGAIRELHDRMPLVLPANEWNTWLDGSAEDAATLLEQDKDVLARRGGDLLVVPVSTWVNNVKHDDPRCIEPADPDAPSPAAARRATSRQMDFGFEAPGPAAPARAARVRSRQR